MDLGIIYSYTLDANSRTTKIIGDKTMTRDDAKKLLPIIQAYVEGKNIQYEVDIDRWEDIENPSFRSFVKYRIKPEPKYRPFKTQE